MDDSTDVTNLDDPAVYADYMASLATESERLRSAVLAAPDAPVAACPEWNNMALLDHMGDVYNFIVAQVRSEAQEIATPASKPEAIDAVDWFDQTCEEIQAALGEADPTAAAWTWSDRTDNGFYFRRMAHETLIHRYDAQLAAGDAVDPIDPALAADGIDELFDVGIRFRTRGPVGEWPSGSLHLHQTDGDGEWMVQAVDGELVVTHEHGKGDAAVRGTAEALLLYLWGRGRGDTEHFGDAAVAEAWATAAP